MPELSKWTETIVGPASGAAAVTPHDTNELATWARSLYIGVSGNVKVTTVNGDTPTFTNVPVGVLPVRCKLVWSTGTTATGILAMY